MSLEYLVQVYVTSSSVKPFFSSCYGCLCHSVSLHNTSDNNALTMKTPFALADLRKHPPTAQDFLNFMQFFGNFGKSVC